MASLLRRSGNLARYSRGITESAARLRHPSIHPRPQSHLSSFVNAQRCRTYATSNEGDPKPPNNGKDSENGSSAPSPGGNNNGGKDNGPQKSKYTLNKKETEELNKCAQQLKNNLPPSQGKVIDEAVELLKKEGLSDEVKSLMKEMQDGKPISLASAAKFVRVFTKHTWKAASSLTEKEMDAEAKREGKTPQESQSQKSRTPDESEGAKNKSEQKSEQEQQEKKQGQQQEKKTDGENESQSRPQFNAFGMKIDVGNLLVAAVISYYIYRSISPGETTKDITWQEFRTTFFDKGLVERLTVFNGNRVRVELHREAVASTYPESPASQPNFYYYFTIGSVEAFERNLDEAHKELGIPSQERIPVAYTDKTAWLPTLLSLGPTLFLLGSLFWISRRAGGGGGGQSGIFGIGKSRAKRFNHETDVKVKFADVAGMDEAKVEIMEFVSFLNKPEKFQRLGAKIPRGAILSGPPGTGKTLLAKATAGESGVPFYSVSGSEFVEMFVGVGPSRVRDLFATARKNTPCIIFIDEIDAIGKSRAKQNHGGGNDERESTLNQILTEMDGFNTSEQVVVLAGTNRADILDKALLRPGRFDRHINIDPPTMDGRKQIFAVHLKKVVTREDMEYLKGRLSALTPGFSGADIANCVNEAALVGKLSSFAKLSPRIVTLNSNANRFTQLLASMPITLP